MKTEDFDEAIRKKVEGIDHKFTEKDIDKVVRHLGKNPVYKGKGISGSTMFYSLAAAAATGLLAWYLVKNNGSIQQNPEKPSSNAALLADSLPKADTAQDRATLNFQARDQISAAEEKSAINASMRHPRIVTDTTVKPDPLSGRSSSIPVETESTVNEIKTEVLPGEPNVVNKTLAYTPDSIPKAVLPEQGIELTINQGSDTLVPVIPEISGEPGSEISEKEPFKDKEIPVSPGTEAITSQSKGETGVSDSNSKKKPGSENNFFTFSDFMAGAGFELASNNLGVGIESEVSFAERLRFSAGVKYISYQEVKFDNKEDFDRHNHRKINHRFEDHLKDKEHVSEITIHSSLIQLPVAFRYQIPLKNKFSFLFSLGTDLDVALNQQLRYNQSPDSLGPHHDDFEARGDAVFFNNMVISAGIEKRWKHLVFQAHPFMKPQMKQVFYKPKEFDFGLGVSLLYSF